MMDDVQTLSVFENETCFCNDNDTEVMDVPPLYLLVPEWSRIGLKNVMAVMFVVGTFGNIVLILVLQKKKSRKRSSTANYVICLAAGDILTLLYNCPVDYLRSTPELWDEVGSDLLFRLYFYISHAVYLMSLILVFGIGIDLFYKVFRPHFTIELLDRASKRICLATIGTSVIVSIIFLITSHQDSNGICKLNPDYKHFNGVVYVIFNELSLSLSVVLGCVYIRITLFLRRREHARRMRIFIPGRHDREGVVRVGQDEGGPNMLTDPRLLTVSSSSTVDQGRRITTGTDVWPNNQRIGMHPVTRTTITMSLITIVQLVTTVSPAIALGIFSFGDGHSENANIIMFFTFILSLVGNVAHPILFIVSSSEFRELLAQMFCSFCFNAP